MFTTSIQHNNADALAGDFAAIARIEETLSHAQTQRRARSTGDSPDFSRLKRFIPDLKI